MRRWRRWPAPGHSRRCSKRKNQSDFDKRREEELKAQQDKKRLQRAQNKELKAGEDVEMVTDAPQAPAAAAKARGLAGRVEKKHRGFRIKKGTVRRRSQLFLSPSLAAATLPLPLAARRAHWHFSSHTPSACRPSWASRLRTGTQKRRRCAGYRAKEQKVPRQTRRRRCNG